MAEHDMAYSDTCHKVVYFTHFVFDCGSLSITD